VTVTTDNLTYLLHSTGAARNV